MRKNKKKKRISQKALSFLVASAVGCSQAQVLIPFNTIAAETAPKSGGSSEIHYGDVNNDGVVDSRDAAIIEDHVLDGGKYDIDATIMETIADVDQDGKVTLRDAELVLQCYERVSVGMENNLPNTGDIKWKYYPDPANYEVINEGMTWLEAEDYCEANGGHLAVITSNWEQAVVESLVKGQESRKSHYWIGGRLSEEGKFEWITGEPMEYTNWGDGEPNNQGGGQLEDSLHLFPSCKWNDLPNSGIPGSYNIDSIGFVMEKDEKPVTYNLWTDTDSLPISGKYKLGCDVTAGRITVKESLDLDLNGHTVSAKQIVCSGDVTIRDSSNNKGAVNISSPGTLFDVYGKLTICGGKFKINGKSDKPAIKINDNGQFELSGGEIESNNRATLLLGSGNALADLSNGIIRNNLITDDPLSEGFAILLDEGYTGTLNIRSQKSDNSIKACIHSVFSSAIYENGGNGVINISGGLINAIPKNFIKHSIFINGDTTINLQGLFNIPSGIYLPKGKKVNITGHIVAANTEIFSEESGVVTNGWSKYSNEPMNCGINAGKLYTDTNGELFFRVKDDDMRYKVIDQALTWKEAEAYCESIGGHLVTITSSEEQSEIAALASNLSTCFLGGIRNAEGVFEWVTGEDMTYSYWNSGEPNNGLGGGNENVIEMYSSGVWNDCGEYLTKYFICEWDNLPVVIPIYTTTSTTSTTTTTTTTTTVTTTAIPENAIKWYIDTVEAYPGETVDLEVRVENKKDYSVDIQKADLRLKKTDGLVLNYIASGNAYTYYHDSLRFVPEKSAFAEIASKDGQEVCYIRFKIPEDCKAGEYPVKFEGTPKITDVNGVDISKNFVFQNGAVIVVNPPVNTDTTASTTSTTTTTTTTTTREPFAPVTTEYDPQVEKQVEEKKNEKLKITGELTATPMTKEEIVKAGIDVDDPDNYHYFNYSIELTFHDEPIVFTKYEAVPITPSSPSTPSEPVQVPTPKIVFPNTDPVPPGEPVHIPDLDITVTYYEYEEQEMYIIVYGRSKWLKEFYDVQLIVFNTDTETLEDCSATLNVPEGLTLCNSKQTQNVGDLLPMDVKNIHWYLRGDVAGDYSLSALFKGTNDGDEFSYVFNSEDNIHVYAGDALKMTIEAPSYSCYEFDYPIKITLTNVSDKPIYDLEHKIKNVDHGYYSYNHINNGGISTCIESKHNLGGGMTKTVNVDELLPGESAVIELSIHDMWKSPLQKQLENSKLFIDALSLGLGRNPLAACIASFASKCIEGITVIHVLDSFCVTTLKDSTTTIPYEIIITDNIDDIAKDHEFDLRDAVVSSVMDQAPSGLKRFYVGGKYYIDAFKFVSDLKDNAEADWAKVENGDMTVEQFQKKYNKEYLDHIFSNLSTYSDIAGLDISGILQVESDIYKIVSVPVDSSTCTAYVTDANGNIIEKGEVSRNPRPGMLKKVWAAEEPEFEFEVLSGDFEYSNGVYTITEDSLIRMKANKAGEKYLVHFVTDDGHEEVFPFVTVPEHDCTPGKFYVINGTESGNEGLAMQFCEVCDKPVKSRKIPASFNAMLSDGQMFQNIYHAAEFAADNYDEIELSIFGDITLDKDLVIPENVKLIITPFANITYKNSAHIVVDGEYIDFTQDKEDIYENIVLEYWDGRTEIMPVKYGEEVSELPALSETCGFNGWYTDAEFTEPFVPFTSGDKNHSKVYYADVHHSFKTSGKCSKCGELKNGMDAFQKVGISVSSEINLKFIVSLTEKALADKNLRVVFELSDGQTATQYLSDAIDNGNGTYTFNYSVPINKIDENVKAQVRYSNGVKGSYLDYSVKKYTDYIINNASSFDKVTVDSIKALVNFSGYVQIFAGKDADEAVNADLGMSLDDVVPEISDKFKAVKKENSSAVTIKTASLSMDKLSNINIKFELAEGADLNDYIFTVDGKEVKPKKTGKQYIISMNGISPVNFDKMYLFKAQSRNDATDYASVEYSCLTYAKKVLEISSDKDLKNAMKALYLYNQEIKKYLNEKNDN